MILLSHSIGNDVVCNILLTTNVQGIAKHSVQTIFYQHSIKDCLIDRTENEEMQSLSECIKRVIQIENEKMQSLLECIKRAMRMQIDRAEFDPQD